MEPPGEPAPLPDPQPQGEAASAAVVPSGVWLPELVQRYAPALSCNEVACALRLVNKATAAQFHGPQDRSVRLSLPVPHHAFVQRWSGEGAMRGLTMIQRQQLCSLTARSGSTANLEFLLALEDCACLGEDAFWAAADAGQLEVCRWLRQQGCCPWDSYSVLDAAAAGGHQDVCEWLLASGCPWSCWAASRAARGGHVGLMDWLLSMGPSEGVVAAAAAGGDLPTLQLLHSKHLPQEYRAYSRAEMVACAASSLTADWRAKVEWLEGQGFPQDTCACVRAVKQPEWRGRLEWLQQRGHPLTGYAAAAAASVGAVDALQYVLDSGVALGEDDTEAVTREAADGGHLAVLQELHARGFDIAGTATAAARYGHLPVVAWLVEVLGADKVLSARLFASAATSGKRELLAWLHDRGCPWDQGTFEAAAAAGCEEQLEWLAACGCPMGENGRSYALAARNSDLATLRCLQRLGCPLGAESGGHFALAIKYRQLVIVDDDDVRYSVLRLQRGLLWLLERVKMVVDWDAAERAVQHLEQHEQEELLTW
ncbi:Ankyrin repeat domain-containing protein, partial [Tetrabaena socialis]